PAATRPSSRPVPVVVIRMPPEPLAVRVDKAIGRGLKWLYAAEGPDGTFPSRYARLQPGGVEALVALTALSAGHAPGGTKLTAILKYLDGLEPHTTYVRALRAMVYSRLARTLPEAYGPRLADDVAWLVKFQKPSGGWGYGPAYPATARNPDWMDNSNTFLAMLALDSAAAAGADVPADVWSRARIYWSRAANPDGGMGYQVPLTKGFRLRGSSYGSMTAAGVLALYMLADQWAAHNEPPFTNVSGERLNPNPYAKAIAGGLGWLGKHMTLEDNPKWVWARGEAYEYYFLYCLDLLADAGGIWRMGGSELASASAEVIVSRQRPDGGWSDPHATKGSGDLDVIRTCFALLALLRARGPVILQRMALSAGPPNDSRDAANLVRWTDHALGWQASWRAVSPQATARRFGRAPVLYIHAQVKDYPAGLDERLRRFVLDGGTVIVQPHAASEELFRAAKDYFTSIFPRYSAAAVPDSHPVFSLRFKVPLADRPKLFALGDGLRLCVFIFASDVAGAWHQRRSGDMPQCFQLGANLLLYATDMNAPPGKLARIARPAGKPARPLRFITAARVKHAGGWDVCPGALRRVGEVLAEAVSIGVKEAPPVDLASPVPAGTSVLWMTGTSPPKLPATALAHLKDYVQAGGTLFVDSAGGGGTFAAAARAMLAETFGPAALQPVAGDHPLITGEFAGGIGADVTKVHYTRAAAAEMPPGQPPKLFGVTVNGHLAVVFSPYSVTCPLLGRSVFGCKGLAPRDAARLAANVVLYAAAAAANDGRFASH
ncbi:MAG: DUF4159 domain-containing protein, partial [Planctomycetes bacterium]|nr:DUF4159 domain-containing protein [Planctomycetota bacterium]